MGDLTTLHSHAKRLVLLLKEGLERLESAELRGKLHDLQVISSDMESVWRMFVIRENASKRAVWKGKVDQVVEELAEREELFSGSKGAGPRPQGGIDEEAQLQGSFARSKRALGEIYETGANILTNMSTNKERLKRIQRKTLDVLNSVGLGETMLRLIERRQRMDLWITYAGMAVVTLVVILVMWISWR
ncbi:Qb-snare protein, Bos1/Membrin family [Dunaliella salina]|uniref:Qb-snare protein, Bos1/Membrin family n=1 Tax=Dunaliella salina TaxID=3046 RepID=A0ABQ7GTT6_DUNSA|nr:Qb-snare protein, Bos1/Membrin family [Dunaliella salina]|eukprot:KAF5838021.1 Qb-snare protein, Bos1/Membrin family [Dunaliella salina]